MSAPQTPPHEQLKAQGVAAHDLQRLQALPHIDWQALLALVGKYGPGIVQELLAVFGKQTP